MQTPDCRADFVENKVASGGRGALRVREWQHLWGTRTLIMAVVNVTPDSFSGDGLTDTNLAVAKAHEQARLGADIIDLGGESTRPGYQIVDSQQEAGRVVPVVAALRRGSAAVVSVDTTKPLVFREALLAGADILNSVAPVSDELLAIVGEFATPMVITHNQEKPVYESGVVDEVLRYLHKHAGRAIAVGIKPEHVILDPGIGFGKTADDNLAVLAALGRIVSLGFPTLIGTSRKSFIGKITGQPVDNREFGTAATVALAIAAGIDIVRVHDVEKTNDVVKISDAIVRGWRPHNWHTD